MTKIKDDAKSTLPQPNINTEENTLMSKAKKNTRNSDEDRAFINDFCKNKVEALSMELDKASDPSEVKKKYDEFRKEVKQGIIQGYEERFGKKLWADKSEQNINQTLNGYIDQNFKSILTTIQDKYAIYIKASEREIRRTAETFVSIISKKADFMSKMQPDEIDSKELQSLVGSLRGVHAIVSDFTKNDATDSIPDEEEDKKDREKDNPAVFSGNVFNVFHPVSEPKGASDPKDEELKSIEDIGGWTPTTYIKATQPILSDEDTTDYENTES